MSGSIFRSFGLFYVFILCWIVTFTGHAQESSEYIFSPIHIEGIGRHVWDVADVDHGELAILSPSRVTLFNGQTVTHSFNCSGAIRKISWNDSLKSLEGGSLFGFSRTIDKGEINTLHQDLLSRYSKQTLVTISKNKIYSIDRESGIVFVENEQGNKVQISHSDRVSNPIRIFGFGRFLCIQNEDTLFFFNKRNGNFTHSFTESPKVFGTDEDEKNLLVQRDNALFQFQSRPNYSGLKFRKVIPDIQNPIRAIEYKSDNEFWVATSRHLIHVRDGHISKSILPHGELVNSLYYSKNKDILFISTETDGLIRADTRLLSSIFSKESGPKSISSIHKLNGQIFVTENNGALYEYKDDELIISKIKDIPQLNSVNDINDTLLLSTYYGEQFTLTNKLKSYSLPEQNLCVYKVLKSKKTGIYYVSSSKGIFSGKHLNDLKHIKSIQDKTVEICELKDGTIAFGQEKFFGLFNPRNQEVQFLSITTKEVPISQVRAIFEDDDGTIWVGTYGNGLYCKKKNEFIHVNKLPNCKLSNDIFTLTPWQESLLMASNNGLYTVSLKDLKSFVFGDNSILIPTIITKTSGSNTNEFNGMMAKNVVQLDSNNLLFASIKGVIKFHGTIPTTSKQDLRVLSVSVDGNLASLQNLQLNDTHKEIDLALACSNFLSGNQQYCQYRWRNKREKEEWSGLIPFTSVLNIELNKTGDYFLDIRVVDSSNDEKEALISLPVNIKINFFKSDLFIVICTISGLLILIILLLILRKRRVQKLKHQRDIDAQINNLKHQVANSKMKPHFLFNSLNGLHSLIALKNYDKVEELLPQFSQLLRRLVENQDHQVSTLEKELSFIREYLSIEQMRIGKNMHFDIIPDDFSEPFHIPHGVLLPFVENAVVHGISPNENGGYVNLIIQNVDDTLCNITIINTAPSNPKKSHRENHKSTGLTLVEDIIQNWSQKFDSEITYEVTYGEAIKVKISIPKIEYSDKSV